jgi:hypothetical protein
MTMGDLISRRTSLLQHDLCPGEGDGLAMVAGFLDVGGWVGAVVVTR